MRLLFSAWLQMILLLWFGVAFSMSIGAIVPTEATGHRQNSQFEAQTILAAGTFIVWPKDGTKKAQTDEIQALLVSLVGKSKFYTSQSRYAELGVAFWSCELTADQEKKVVADKYVAKVEPAKVLDKPKQEPAAIVDPPYFELRKRRLTRQPEVEKEMKFISVSGDAWPKRETLKDRYIFDESAGRGSTIYVIDNGADLANDEFSLGANNAQQWQWLFAGPDTNNERNEHNSLGHGSCMLSKAVGKKYGVAKLANPVIVKVPFLSPVAVYLDGVIKAYDHHRQKYDADNAVRAIVSMSWVYPQAQLSQEYINELAQVIRLFVQIGGNPISGAGNEGQTPQHPQGGAPVDGYPALFADPTDPHHIPELLVVGAVDREGQRWVRSQNAPFVTGYAVGVGTFDGSQQIKCAGLNGATQLNSGTSQATASVAGLAAYFLALPNDVKPNPEDRTVQGLKNYVTGLQYSRNNMDQSNYPFAIWNGVDTNNFKFGDGSPQPPT